MPKVDEREWLLFHDKVVDVVESLRLVNEAVAAIQYIHFGVYQS